MHRAESVIDLKNLTLWWISQLFMANSDIYQGLALLNQNIDNPKWFWINWDMDMSIRNKWEHNIKNSWEQELEFRYLMKGIKISERPRAIIFKRLLEEDREFIRYFEKQLVESLNHRLADKYLQDLIKKYELTLKSFNNENPSCYREAKLFFKNRPLFLFKLLQKYLDSPEHYQLQIKRMNGIKYKIDGHTYSSDYTGRYFAGSRIIISTIDEGDRRIKYWIINNKKVSHAPSLSFRIKDKTVVQPVF